MSLDLHDEEAVIEDLRRRLQEADEKRTALETELWKIQRSKIWRAWLWYHAVRETVLHPARFMKRMLGRVYLSLWTATALLRTALRGGRTILPVPAGRIVSPPRRPRILMVLPYTIYPPDHGGGVRLYNLVRCLSRHCDLHLLIFNRSGNEQQRAALEPFVTTLHFYPWHPVPQRDQWDLEPRYAMLFRAEEVQSLIRKVIAEEHIDVLQLEYTELGQYGMTRYDGVKTVLVLHDISFRSCARSRRAGIHRRDEVDSEHGLSWMDCMRLLRYELRVTRRMDQIHVMSAADGSYIARFLPMLAKTIRIVPNAVDLGHYTVPAPGSRSRRRILFAGNFGHIPNLDALDYLMREIWPLVLERTPDAELDIVGANPGPGVLQYGGKDGITIVGRVDDVAPHYQSCAMLVTPLRAGSGTRLKILEALACGTPVVTTTIGAEGIDGVAGEHFLISDEPAAFADAICRLLDNPELCARLGANGRTLVEHHYGWEASADAALAAYAELIAP